MKGFKKINNRTIIGIVCIVLALVITFGAAPLVNRISDRKTDIVRVVNRVERGREITAQDIEVVKVVSLLRLTCLREIISRLKNSVGTAQGQRTFSER